ncbi:unnamed protein product [Schistosoma turkestanicum]|nr:unnamed protein product [Schistosoma turkestanicum]
MSDSESKDENLQYTYHTNSETFSHDISRNSVPRYNLSEDSQVADGILGKEPVNKYIQYSRPETNIPNICVESSSQNLKHHLKKLHLAANKIIDNDRLTKYNNPSKKNLKGNQEAYEKMLDAVKELKSFVVQHRPTLSSSSNRSMITKKVQSRIPTRVRSNSTTYDDSISQRLNLTGKTGHRSDKSVRRSISLTKRSKSPIHHSISPNSVFNTECSRLSENLNISEGVNMFSQSETKYQFSVKSDTFVTSNQETEYVQNSEAFTNPEIACLEAELSHRDTLIKYLSEELLKIHQDNDRIFAEYESQEANLTNHLRLLRSRLTETNYHLGQQNTINNHHHHHHHHTDRITHITSQSLSQQINFNVTDSIVHHFATEINDKIIQPTINSSNNYMNQYQTIEQPLLVELNELDSATRNLLNYWEIKSQEINYSSVCQQFFKALLKFFVISMKPYNYTEESNEFLNPHLNDLQVKAEKAEQQIIDLSNEIKNYQIQLDRFNEKLKQHHFDADNNIGSNSNDDNKKRISDQSTTMQYIVEDKKTTKLVQMTIEQQQQQQHSMHSMKPNEEHSVFNSAEQTLLKLAELHELLQKQLIQKSNISLDANYAVNQVTNTIIDNQYDIINDEKFTEKLQSLLNVIYDELSLCQQLVDKLLNQKSNHCTYLSEKTKQIQELNQQLKIPYRDELRAPRHFIDRAVQKTISFELLNIGLSCTNLFNL